MNIFKFPIAFITLIFIASCSDRVIVPPNNSESCIGGTPTYFTDRLAEGMWIYERTHLDANGNELPFPKTYDTLHILHHVRVEELYGKASTALLNHYTTFSSDGKPINHIDTIYFNIVNGSLYVNYPSLQGGCTNCATNYLLRWRKYTDPDAKICNGIVQKAISNSHDEYIDTLTSQVNGQPQVNVIKNAITTNFYSDVESSTYTVKGYVGVKGVIKVDDVGTFRAIITHSDYFLAMDLLEPVNALFMNGTKRQTVSEKRTIWSNEEVGILRERVIINSDVPTFTNDMTHSYDKRLVDIFVIQH